LRAALKAGVVSRTDIPDVVPVTKRVVKLLREHDVDVLVETDTSMALNMNEDAFDLSDLDADIIITIGGDGTILRTAMDMKDPSTPLLGVNMGRRGFLSEVRKEEVEQAIHRVVARDYFVEDCMKLGSRCLDAEEEFPDSLNEVLVSSSLPSKMLVTRLSVDGEQIAEIQADGVLVSTPTGSTAYNLSAGGSILAPTIDAMIMTAICPYSYFRSITLPSKTRVSIELLKPRADALAIIDGKVYMALKPLSTVEVYASRHRARFVRFKPFYARLRGRLTHLQSQ
jgi:NAD+ kinase